MNEIDVSTPRGRQVRVRYADTPDACPVCKYACEVNRLGTAIIFPETELEADQILQIIFRCPRNNCGRLFIAQYYSQHDGRGRYYFQLSTVYPQIPDKARIADGVANISAKFVEIVNQSLAAESHNLDQLVGMGLRKALEFLIKDYCVLKHPDKEAEIKARPLGRCITDYISDSNIKDCAARATWLGNDETHYTRVWTEKDINDLKILIQLTQNWISNELLTEKYRSTMPELRVERT